MVIICNEIILVFCSTKIMKNERKILNHYFDEFKKEPGYCNIFNWKKVIK